MATDCHFVSGEGKWIGFLSLYFFIIIVRFDLLDIVCSLKFVRSVTKACRCSGECILSLWVGGLGLSFFRY